MKKLITTLTVLLAVSFLQAAPLTFKGADKNKDGSINKEEWMAAQAKANPDTDTKKHANWFKNWDKDKDGKITQKEFDARKTEQKARNKK